MTLLAGAFRRSGPLQNADELLASLSALISRNAADTPHVVRDERALLLKVDIGAFQQPAALGQNGVATLVAGEPLIVYHDAPRDRMTDTAALATSLRDHDLDALRRARGLFSVAQYDAPQRCLRLATDKHGVRALYWWTDGDLVVFSSTLRVLEGCAFITKRLDLRGLAERLAIGYPLGPRTPYEGISMLGAAEMIEFTHESVASSTYWRWQDLESSDAAPAELSRRAFDAFRVGVRLRLGGDRATSSFLSGGLDSRCVVGALRMDDVAVHTINFAEPNTEEREFAGDFARKIGTVHEEHVVNRKRHPAWIFTLSDILGASTAPIHADVARPHVVWSGDGGSVGLGHVHMGEKLVQQARAGSMQGVIDAFFAAEKVALPQKLLQPAAMAVMRDAPRRGMTEELTRLEAGGLAQAFYLSLMQNDQRRGLQPHFEQIDLHRLEALLPFLDAEFVSVVATVPMDLRLRHAFYNDWLAHFDPAVANTPWQSYPGHVPCPVPNTRTLVRQWDKAARVKKVKRERRAMRSWGIRTAASRAFAGAVMRRHVVLSAAVIDAIGLRDCQYQLKSALTIQRHWRVCLAAPTPASVPAGGAR